MNLSTSFVGALHIILLSISHSLISADARKWRALHTHAQNVVDPGSDESTHLTPEEASHANEKSYRWRVEEDSMILAHSALRKEVTDMGQVLKKLSGAKKTLEEWQINCIKGWWKGHEAHMRFHCRNENDHLHPIMGEKLIDFPSNRMKNDHATIHKNLDTLTSTIKTLGGSSVDQLQAKWNKYADSVLDHFQSEEKHSVVPVRRAFHVDEWGPITRAFFDMGAKEEFGSMIHSMGEDYFRQKFMKQRRIPGFVWRLRFKPNHDYYKKTMWRHMEALQRDRAPE